MKQTEKSSIQLLRDAIERDYDEFQKTVIGWTDPDIIYGFAPEISAVRDVYHYMTTHDWADEDEAFLFVSSLAA